jgi:hypothetical protein
MSTGVSGVSVVPSGGIRKEREGARNTSMTSVSAAWLAVVMLHSASMRVGRRVPRASVLRSVMALNNCSAAAC